MKKHMLYAVWLLVSLTAIVCVGRADDTNSVVASQPQVAASNSTPDAQTILDQLLAGNQRFVSGLAIHTNQTITRRAELAGGQHPVAIVLSCSDSRVPPEIVFDQGLGDLFVIRNAGNILDDHVIGSMEYAVEHLHVSLLVVLGHAQCGAVKAAVAGGETPNHIHSILDAIEPAVEAAKGQSGDLVDNAVRANVLRVAGQINHIEPILSEAIKSGHLKVVGARYDLETGKVEILQ